MISFVVALLGWAVVYALPNQYASKAVVQIDTRSIMTPLLKGLAVESNTVNGLDTMSRVLLSRENLNDVIRQTDMGFELNNTGDMGGIVEKLARSITLQEVGSSRKRKKERQ